MFAWIAAAILMLLGVFSLTQIFYAHPDPVWGVFVVTACFVVAAFLLFPPAWRNGTARSRHIRIAIVLALVVVWLFFPIKTTITVPLPYAPHAK
jgi:hypothetical protein